MAALTNGDGAGLDHMGHDAYRLSPVGKDSHQILLSPRKEVRQIARTPFKVLDAPELAVSRAQDAVRLLTMKDDFYLNLVSWSASNALAVGLSNCVYLWSAQSAKVTKLCDLNATESETISDSVTGLEWTNRVSQCDQPADAV